MRIGILGGSFDPIHIGHLLIAEEARRHLDLERVWFVPAGVQWMKEGRPMAPADDRLAMVKRAIASNPAFEASDVDIVRPGRSYSVDTVKAVGTELGPDGELYFILGQDAFAGLPRWERPRELLALCRLVVLPRPDSPHIDWDWLEKELPGLRKQVTVLNEAVRIQVSSTEIRGRLAQGESVRYLLSDEVLAYIEEKRLYKRI